jgi:LCP family protein required for cell wall assembly
VGENAWSPAGAGAGGTAAFPAASAATAAQPWDAPAEDAPPFRRRSGAGAGRGPGRQTGATGPGRPDGHVNDDIDLDDVDPNGKAQRAWAKQQAASGRRSRAKQATKWGAIGMALVLLAAGGFVAYVYETTVGSIKHTALTPSGMTQSSLPADPYGNRAQNILLIGSDTRNSSGDCSLGGDCGAGANADSEMILHVSAERTNATILSIPRDTVATLPDCVEDKSGNASLTGKSSTYQINSALQNGPECQVAADHALTGITITGYIMFDFSGIVTMSNALGGVPVCVTKPVDDKNSGLKLSAGTTDIKGDQALEFLRTRDSFFDSSDLGREEATHYFLAQMIQSLRTSVNFTSLSTLINIGQAAAKATTVSNNFAGLTNLEGLVETLDKVPTKSITMMTMPWDLDPGNQARVVVDPSAQQVFKDIQDDTSFTNTSKSATSTASKPASPTVSPSAADSSTANVVKSQVPVNVYNADGVSGRATAIVQALHTDGFSDSVSAGNAPAVSSTIVNYNPNEVTKSQALAVAAALGVSSAQVQSTTNFRGVSVFIGADFTSGTTLGSGGGGGSAATSPAADTSGAASAPSVAYESFASGSANQCIPVKSGNLQMASK